jgi:hypothetical protein
MANDAHNIVPLRLAIHARATRTTREPPIDAGFQNNSIAFGDDDGPLLVKRALTGGIAAAAAELPPPNRSEPLRSGGSALERRRVIPA